MAIKRLPFEKQNDNLINNRSCPSVWSRNSRERKFLVNRLGSRRQEDDYSAFQPYLETNLKLRREQASAIGYEASPYDVLLDDYEPGENSENLKQVLRGLREALVPLIAELGEAKDQPVDQFLRQTYPVERQEQFGIHVATRLGFDFSRGRLDITDHPFCTEIGPHDHRILTRYNPKDFSQAFYGILHEAGHGIYDQG